MSIDLFRNRRTKGAAVIIPSLRAANMMNPVSAIRSTPRPRAPASTHPALQAGEHAGRQNDFHSLSTGQPMSGHIVALVAWAVLAG